MNTNIKIAEAWFNAFNKHDVEELLSLYDDNAKHFSPKLRDRHPETEGLVVGKDALRTWWADAFERLPQLRYEPWNFIASDKAVFMEYIRKVGSEADLRVGEVLEIENGKIVASRVYHG